MFIQFGIKEVVLKELTISASPFNKVTFFRGEHSKYSIKSFSE
jgi:hypothetical protein